MTERFRRFSDNQMLVTVGITKPHPHQQRLQVFTALVDTGAQKTAVTRRAVEQMGLPYADDGVIRFLDAKPTETTLHFAHMGLKRVVVEKEFEGDEEFSRLVPLKVIQLPGHRTSNNYDVVLGMDFLSHCTFTLRGPDRQFHLDLAGPRPHHSFQDKRARYRTA